MAPIAPVHHVGRGDDVTARLGLHHRLFAERLERRIIDDITVLDQTVLTVARIGIESHITEHADPVCQIPLDGPHGPADQILRIPRLLGTRVFFAGSVAGNSATAGIPSSTASPTASSNRSIDSRSTPGIDGIGFATSCLS